MIFINNSIYLRNKQRKDKNKTKIKNHTNFRNNFKK